MLSFPHYSDVGTCRGDANGGAATIRADFQPHLLGGAAGNQFAHTAKSAGCDKLPSV